MRRGCRRVTVGPVIITIDTTHALNDADRALLRTLLDGAPPAPVHRPASGMPRPNSAAAIASAIRAPGVGASARGPVANQPGVSFTESTSEEDPHADR